MTSSEQIFRSPETQKGRCRATTRFPQEAAFHRGQSVTRQRPVETQDLPGSKLPGQVSVFSTTWALVPAVAFGTSSRRLDLSRHGRVLIAL